MLESANVYERVEVYMNAVFWEDFAQSYFSLGNFLLDTDDTVGIIEGKD